MKICIVSLNSLPVISADYKLGSVGGAEVQLGQLAAALARRGHDVSMIVADYGQHDGSVHMGIKTYVAFDPEAGRPIVRFVYPRSFGLWRAATRANADVYLCSTASMIVGLMAIYCRLHGRRFVFRVASDSDCDPSQLLIKYGRDRWLYRMGLARADAVLVQSEWQRAKLKASFGRDSTLVRGLVERPMSSAVATTKDVDVLWIANLRKLKRPEKFLELALALPGYRFHMAGGPSQGEEALFGQIELRAKAISNLTFHGPIPYLDVGRFFDRARLFVNTSEIEGFPNTFLQAWIRGIPVVTLFDPDGVVKREALGTSHTDMLEMAKSVASLLQSGDAYNAARIAALAYMDRHFSEAEILSPYLEVLAPAELQAGG